MKCFLLCVALSLVLVFCSKNHVDTAAKKAALTTGTWKLTGYMTDYNKDGVYEEDTYARLADCEKDNIFTFHEDGTQLTDEGSTKCISSNPQTRTSSWSASDNYTKLQWGGTNYQVEELTSTALRLKARVSYNFIYTIDVKWTYTKQ